MTYWFSIGLALAVSGCACFYLASPRQTWRGRPWPRLAARLSGVVLLVAAFVVLLQAQQATAAVYTLLTVAMTALVLAPYLGAWRALRRRR